MKTQTETNVLVTANSKSLASNVGSVGAANSAAVVSKSGVIKGLPPTPMSKIDLFKQSGTQYEPQTIVSRNLQDPSQVNVSTFGTAESATSAATSNRALYFIDRPLEKIEERHTESESEGEQDSVREVVPPPLKTRLTEEPKPPPDDQPVAIRTIDETSEIEPLEPDQGLATKAFFFVFSLKNIINLLGART